MDQYNLDLKIDNLAVNEATGSELDCKNERI